MLEFIVNSNKSN